MRFIRPLPLAAIFIALALPAVAASPILPGYWESENHSDLLIRQDSVSRKCITPAQVDSYLSGPANNHYSCVYDHREVHDGSLRLAGKCTDNNGMKMDVAIAGTYTLESFHLRAQLHTRFASLPIAGTASIDAHRLSGDCPAPEPKPTPPAGY